MANGDSELAPELAGKLGKRSQRLSPQHCRHITILKMRKTPRRDTLDQGSGTYGSSGDGMWLPDNFELRKKNLRPPPCNFLSRARLQQK